MTKEMESKFVAILARGEEDPTPEDLSAIAEADAEDSAETITLEAYKERKRCAFRGV